MKTEKNPVANSFSSPFAPGWEFQANKWPFLSFYYLFNRDFTALKGLKGEGAKKGKSEV